MDCPGVPILFWQPWPEGLYTTQQLAEKGYKPGDKLDFGQFGDSTLELGVASGGITEGIEQALD